MRIQRWYDCEDQWRKIVPLRIAPLAKGYS
jgi:hypothetical protein